MRRRRSDRIGYLRRDGAAGRRESRVRHEREDGLRRPSWRVRLRDLFASRSFPFVAAAVAIVLTLPSLRVGWIIDDHFHRLVMVGSGRFREGLPDRLDMFRFLTGDRT